jgi:hypothetical protein
MEATTSSQALVCTYEITRHHITEDCDLNIHSNEKLKPHMLTHCFLVYQPIEFLSDMYLAPLPPSPPPYLSPYEIVVEPSHLFDNNNSFLPVVTEQFFGFI